MNLNRRLILLILLIAVFAIQGCEKDENKEEQNLGPIALDCDYFTTDRILENDTSKPVDYVVSCVAKVSANIVIKPGVVIEFADDAGLNVTDGYLRAERTATEKIVFTGVSKVKGSWRGIFFINKSVNNVLDHVVVSYAGGNSFNSNNNRGNIICYSCKVSVTNSEISMGKEDGFNNVYSSGDILAFDGNIITGNDNYPVHSLTIFGYAYGSNNDMTGNGKDYIFLKGGNKIGGNHTWEKTSVPYLIDGNLRIGDNESLTIEAGATLLFEDESEIDVSGGGYFASNGQPDNMVILSGLYEVPGSWLGVINYSGDLRNVMDYTEIAYAGGGAHNSNGDLATIVVWANANQTVTNSILRDSPVAADCAIIAYNSSMVVFTGNTVLNIANEVCQ